MNIKKVAVRTLRYLFLIFFVTALLAVLYGVKRLDRGQHRGIFSAEGSRL